MTDANPRDLIKRLADGLDGALDYTVSSDTHQSLKRLVAEARAYLAQPEPEAPTVMEIIALADETEEEGLGQVDLVRRALARWGNTCPYIVSSDEGTSYCRLAEQS